MFTGLVIAVTVVLLWFTSYRLYKARNIIKREKVEWLALSSFMAGFGIFCYGIRSLFIDLPAVDLFIYRLGITVHLGLSFIPASLFIYRNFISSKSLQRILGWPTVIASLIFAYGCVFPPIRRVVKMAPFEPFPMRMTNYPWIEIIWKNIFIWFCIIVSVILLWTVFYYSAKNRKGTKTASHRNLAIFLLIPLTIVVLIMPFAALQDWYGTWQNIFVYFYLAISAILIWMVSYYVGKKKEADVSLYYGLGVIYLLFPAMLCIFCTPIFARLLYVPGAIFLFLAFRMDAKAIEEETLERSKTEAFVETVRQ